MLTTAADVPCTEAPSRPCGAAHRPLVVAAPSTQPAWPRRRLTRHHGLGASGMRFRTSALKLFRGNGPDRTPAADDGSAVRGPRLAAGRGRVTAGRRALTVSTVLATTAFTLLHRGHPAGGVVTEFCLRALRRTGGWRGHRAHRTVLAARRSADPTGAGAGRESSSEPARHRGVGPPTRRPRVRAGAGAVALPLDHPHPVGMGGGHRPVHGAAAARAAELGSLRQEDPGHDGRLAASRRVRPAGITSTRRGTTTSWHSATDCPSSCRRWPRPESGRSRPS
jgi:hypothetical protein